MADKNSGIIDPPIDDLLSKVDSKYQLVIFASKRAPGGNAWAAPARPQPHPLLVKTSRLRGAALRVLFFGGGVRVVLPDYGDHHLRGTRRMPARPFLPSDPMPEELVQRYGRAVLEAIKPR